MTKIQSILVAYDFSDDSKRALQEAFLLADQFNARISVIHVLPEEVSQPFVKALSEEYHAEIQTNIQNALTQFHGKHTVRVANSDIHVLRGDAVRCIVDKAISSNIDLILIGSHNKSSISRFLLGSVASRVIRYSPMPVFTCRADSKTTFTKILVPVDESTTSEEAIEFAKPFAGHFNAQIQLIHIVDEAYFSHHVDYDSLINLAIQNSQTRMRELKAKHGISTEAIITDERAAHGIIEAIKKDPAIGLVIMTTHGRSGLSRFLLGSTAENLVQHAPCSVITLHPKAHQQEVGKIFKSNSR